MTEAAAPNLLAGPFAAFVESLRSPTSAWRDSVDLEMLARLQGDERTLARAMLLEALVLQRDTRGARGLWALNGVAALDDLRLLTEHDDDLVAAASGFVVFEQIPDPSITQRMIDVLAGDDDDARVLAALHLAFARGVDSELAWATLADCVGDDHIGVRHNVARGLLRHAHIDDQWCSNAAVGAGLYETLVSHPHPAVASFGLQWLSGARHILGRDADPIALGLDGRARQSHPGLEAVIAAILAAGHDTGEFDVATVEALDAEAMIFAAALMARHLADRRVTALVAPLVATRVGFVEPVLESLLNEVTDVDTRNGARSHAFVVAVARALLHTADADSEGAALAFNVLKRYGVTW